MLKRPVDRYDGKLTNITSVVCNAQLTPAFPEGFWKKTGYQVLINHLFGMVGTVMRYMKKGERLKPVSGAEKNYLLIFPYHATPESSPHTIV